MRSAWVLLEAAVALLLWTMPVHGKVQDISGGQSGEYEFHVSFQYSVVNAYGQLRVTLPTAYNTNTAGYQFKTLAPWTTITVVDASGGSVEWYNSPYNQGELNSGNWITVVNPHPGTQFIFFVKWVVRQIAVVPYGGVGEDVCRWAPNSTYYLSSTNYICVGSDSPYIQGALTSALAQYPTGPLPEHRGDLERIAQYVKETKTYQVSSIISWTSDQVLHDLSTGDCDDFVKLQCALHRQYGVPARCVASGLMNLATPGVGGAPGEAGRHVSEEYWTGTTWEGCEPWVTTNFPYGGQVVFGIAEDLSELYEEYGSAWPPSPTGLGSFDGTTVIDNYGYSYDVNARMFGTRWLTGQELFQPIYPCTSRQPADANHAVSGTGDFTPPAPVPDLHADAVTDHTIHLVWVATGDDGMSGNAAVANLKYSSAPIRTEADFAGATPVSPQPLPSGSGTQQGYTVQGLANCTPYHFALKIGDESGNWSALGDTASAVTRATWSGGHWICDELRAHGGRREEEVLPTAFALYQNEPNPIRTMATFRFDLPHGESVRLEMFDLSGRKVATLRNAWMPAGQHTVEWNGRDVSGRVIRAGTYVYRLAAGSFRAERKLVMLP